MIVHELSLVGVIRTIAIIFLIIYGFRLLARYVFPFFLKRWMNKKMREFQHQGQQQFNQQEQAKEFVKQHEGEVKIKSRGKSSKPESGDLGDFVDYEEVE